MQTIIDIPAPTHPGDFPPILKRLKAAHIKVTFNGWQDHFETYTIHHTREQTDLIIEMIEQAPEVAMYETKE